MSDFDFHEISLLVGENWVWLYAFILNNTLLFRMSRSRPQNNSTLI